MAKCRRKTDFLYGLILIYALVPPMICDVCTTSGASLQVSCDYGCCEENGAIICCPEPYWTWYRIIGITVAGISGLMFVVAVTCCICGKCAAKKKPLSAVRMVVSGQDNTVGPARNDGFCHVEAPPPYVYEPPPKYDDINHQ